MEATESLPMELNKVPVSLNRLERRWRLFRPRTKRHDAVWKQLKHQLWMVINGIRSAHVVDYCAPQEDVVQRVVSFILETEGRDSAAVKLVEVNESLIVCNVDLLRFRRRGLAECTPGNFSFVLAGANLAAPERASKATADLIAMDIGAAVDQLVSLLDRKCAFPKYPVALVGWLLEYPVMYCLDLAENADARNCLGSCPLLLFVICMEREQCRKTEATEIMRFSVPECLCDKHVKRAIAQLLVTLEGRLGCRVCSTTQKRVLTHVVL